MGKCSEWKLSSNYINGKCNYIAYRLIDKNVVDHSGNREYFGHYSEDKAEVQKLVDKLNAEAAE